MTVKEKKKHKYLEIVILNELSIKPVGKKEHHRYWIAPELKAKIVILFGLVLAF